MDNKKICFKVGKRRILGTIIDETGSEFIVSVCGTQVPIIESMIVPEIPVRYTARKRQKRDEIDKLPKLYLYNTKMSRIESILDESCCNRNCLKNLISREDVLYARIKYFSKTRLERKEWLQEYYSTYSSYFFCGNKICSHSFRKIYVISNDLRQAVLSNDFKTPVVIEDTLITKTEIMKSWIENFKENVCDAMPDTGKFVVPFVFNWKDVHESYCTQIILTNASPLTYQSFLCILKTSFPEIKLYKYTRLTKCDTCVSLKMKRNNLNNSNEVVQNQLRSHLEFIKKERQIYMKRNFSDETQNYISIIIDGMTSLLIPHRFPNPKSMATINPLKISPVGLISHTVNKKFIYLIPEIFPKGSNLVISILWCYILTFYENHNFLPDILYFQSDNAAKESKNQYLMCFLALLVKMGYFKEVHFHMLPVGHTHVDVDQMFSNVAKKYKKSNCESMVDLIDLCSKVYSTDNYTVNLVHQIWDFKSWLSPYIQPFLGLSHFHCFSISQDPNDDYPTIKYKKYTSDSEWIGKFEIIRVTPINPPFAYELSSFKYDEMTINSFSKAPFSNPDKKEEFYFYLRNPSMYGHFFNPNNYEYSVPFLKFPLIIRHLFPFIEKNNEVTSENESENEILFVITYPNTPAKIRKMDLKNGKFVILTNYSDREKYFSLGRIKSIPINSLTSNTWIDIFYYSQRENIFSVNRKILPHTSWRNFLHGKFFRKNTQGSL